MRMDVKTWIIIGMGVIIALLLLFGGGSNEDHVRKIAELEMKSRSDEDHIRVLQRRDVKRVEKEREDSIRNVEKDKTYLAKEKKWVSQIARMKANPVVIRIREENPEVDSLINQQDSVIQEQRLRLYESGKYVTELQVQMSEIRRDFNEQIALHVQKFENEKKIADEYRDQAKKERKKKKFNAVLIPISLAAGFVLGTQL